MFATYKHLFQKNEWNFSCSMLGLENLKKISERKVMCGYGIYVKRDKLIVVKDSLFRGVLYKPVYYGRVNSATGEVCGYFSRSSLAKYLRSTWYTFMLVFLVLSLPVTLISVFMGSFGAILFPIMSSAFLYISDRFFIRYQASYEKEIEEIRAFLSGQCEKRLDV